MDQFSHYCILKTYKGIFRKKHAGNIQLFITNTGSTFIGIALLGLMEEGVNAGQMIVRGPSQHMDMFINDMEQDENFMILDTLKVNVKETSKGTYNLSYPKKGKYIKSNLKFEFESEHSDKNTIIYSLHGKINLVFDETIGEKQLKMKALKAHSMFKSALRNKILKGN